jgi:uncharacterized protein
MDKQPGLLIEKKSRFNFARASASPSGSVGYGPVVAIVITILLFFVAQFFAAVVIGLYGEISGIGSEQIFDNLDQPGYLFAYATIAAITQLILMFWFLKKTKTPLSSVGIVKIKPNRDMAWTAAVWAVYMVIAIGVMALISTLAPGVDLEQEQDVLFDTSLSGAILLLPFITLAVWPPLTEEFLMRGILYSGLRVKLAFWHATLITSLLFGLAHLFGGIDGAVIWVAFIDTFLLSILLCYSREKTGSVWPAVGVHAIKNTLAFLFLFVFNVNL